MKLSIIIPSYQDEEGLHQTCQSLEKSILFANATNQVEVIVVDSSDDDLKLTYDTINIKLIKLTKRTFAGEARNSGVKSAVSEWIGFLDCGLDVELDWVSIMLSQQSNDVDVVWGKSEHKTNSIFQRSYIRSFHRPSYSRRYIRSSMMTKSFFNTMNGFTTLVHAGEDIDFYNRLSQISVKEIYVDAQAWYNHYPNNSKQIFKKWLYFTKDNVLINQAKNKVIFILIELVSLLVLTFVMTQSILMGLILLMLLVLVRYSWQVKASTLRVDSFSEALLTLWLISVFDFSRFCGVVWGTILKVSRRYETKS
jgi:glycosyltransferase involved in cell wall biosynthesis